MDTICMCETYYLVATFLSHILLSSTPPSENCVNRLSIINLFPPVFVTFICSPPLPLSIIHCYLHMWIPSLHNVVVYLWHTGGCVLTALPSHLRFCFHRTPQRTWTSLGYSRYSSPRRNQSYRTRGLPNSSHVTGWTHQIVMVGWQITIC